MNSRGSVSIYLLLAIAAYAALALALISSAGYSSEKINEQATLQQAKGKLSVACTYLELLTAGSSTSAIDYSPLKGVRFSGATAYSNGNVSRECLVNAGAGKILRVQ